MKSFTDEAVINKKIDWFFNQINIPIIEGMFIHEARVWDTLCASLTNLKDLQRAKAEYFSLKKINHLEAIGIMQTIYIEQDCIFNLQNALFGLKVKPHESNYSKIREMRNQAFGHPSESGPKNAQSRHFFDIEDDSRQLIRLINWEGAGNITNAHISLPNIVAENSKITIDYLDKTRIEFIKLIQSTMNAFQIKLTDLFRGVSYIFSKLLTMEHDKIAIHGYQNIEDDITKAEQALDERNLLPVFQRQLNVIRFFSGKLKPLLGIQTFNDTEFYAYGSVLRDALVELKKELDEIEPEYS